MKKPPQSLHSSQPKNSSPKRSREGWKIAADFVTSLIDRYGVPGAALILGFVFVVTYADAKQKHEIIEVFVLGKNQAAVYPLLLTVIVFGVLFFGQNHYWRRRVRMLESEIERLAAWKSVHQETAIAERALKDPPPAPQKDN